MKTRRSRVTQTNPVHPPRRMPVRASRFRGQAAGAGTTSARPTRRRNPGRVARSSARTAFSLDSDDEDASDAETSDQESIDDSPAPRRSRRTPLKRTASSASPDPLALSSPTKRRRQAGSRVESDDTSSSGYISPNSPNTPKEQPISAKGRRIGRRNANANAIKQSATAPDGETEAAVLEAPEVIPDWCRLPYFVWVQVFRFAFASLDDRAGVNFLLDASRLCRATAEAALTALYECPPLLTRAMAHGLVDLLAKNPSDTIFNYRSKIVKLQIDVDEIAARTHHGTHLDLKGLVMHAPRLRVVDFYHRKDAAPFRELDDNLRWSYPNTLFEAFGVQEPNSEATASVAPSAHKLLGWRWNRRLMGTSLNLSDLRRLHSAAAFAGLKKLSFVNFQVPSLDKVRIDEAEAIAQDKAYSDTIAQAISALPELEFLHVESSTVMNDYFLSLLPKNLRTLSLINCWDVTAGDLSDFLVSHGNKMENLTLHHNQSLSLAFVAILGSACPGLKSLSMDCKYYNHHAFYNDSDAIYDSVLDEGQVVDWPVGIETIVLKNMRKWRSLEAARLLFQSLVDNSGSLDQLRHLDLKLMLDIPIRQRSMFRDEWVSRMKKVFLRTKTEPLALHTLRPKPKVPGPKGRLGKRSSRGLPVSGNSTRRSSRLAMPPSGSPTRFGRAGRGLRSSVRTRPSYAEPESDDLDMEDADEDEDPMDVDQPSSPGSDSSFIRQGMCEVVEIYLDNERPKETRFDMGDFIDSESDDPADDDYSN